MFRNQNLPIRCSEELFELDLLMNFRSQSQKDLINHFLLVSIAELRRFLFLLASSNINLDLFSFFESEVHII